MILLDIEHLETSANQYECEGACDLFTSVDRYRKCHGQPDIQFLAELEELQNITLHHTWHVCQAKLAVFNGTCVLAHQNSHSITLDNADG